MILEFLPYTLYVRLRGPPKKKRTIKGYGSAANYMYDIAFVPTETNKY